MCLGISQRLQKTQSSVIAHTVIVCFSLTERFIHLSGPLLSGFGVQNGRAAELSIRYPVNERWLRPTKTVDALRANLFAFTESFLVESEAIGSECNWLGDKFSVFLHTTVV